MTGLLALVCIYCPVIINFKHLVIYLILGKEDSKQKELLFVYLFLIFFLWKQ